MTRAALQALVESLRDCADPAMLLTKEEAMLLVREIDELRAVNRTAFDKIKAILAERDATIEYLQGRVMAAEAPRRK